MENLSIPLVDTSYPKPSNLNDFKIKVPLIKWSDPVLKDEGGTKTFNDGWNTHWKHDDTLNINENKMNPWVKTETSDVCTLSVKAGSEHFYIGYVDLGESRHFNVPLTWAGLEWYQSMSSNNSCHLLKIGRQYKNPSDDSTWSYSSDFWGDGNKETVGYFHRIESLDKKEMEKQQAGYILNRLYFGMRTTSGAGSSHNSRINVFNVKFGWGDGDASNNHKMALPKIRRWDRVNKLEFGDAA